MRWGTPAAAVEPKQPQEPTLNITKTADRRDVRFKRWPSKDLGGRTPRETTGLSWRSSKPSAICKHPRWKISACLLDEPSPLKMTLFAFLRRLLLIKTLLFWSTDPYNCFSRIKKRYQFHVRPHRSNCLACVDNAHMLSRSLLSFKPSARSHTQHSLVAALTALMSRNVE